MSKIRQAKIEDISDIKRLLLQVCNVHNKIRSDLFKKDATKYTDDELSKIIEENEKTPVLVFEDEGTIRGYLFAIIKETKGDNVLLDKKELYIDDLCVDEHFRKNGIGRRLYERALSDAKTLGCDFVTLNVWDGNEKARHFYDSLGLKPRKTLLEKAIL